MGAVISSLAMLEEASVREKQESKDYSCDVSPAFEWQGETFRVLLNGHHSFEAAKRDGVAPHLNIVTDSEFEKIGLLEAGEIETFLEAVSYGSDYRDASTGRVIHQPMRSI